MTWAWPLPKCVPWALPASESPAAFAVQRKHDIHTGVDLYAPEGQPVYAVEDGFVVTVDDFTGPNAESPWWEPTRAVFIQGESGVVGYGEILEKFGLKPGDFVQQGEYVGYVKRVLKKNKEHTTPTSMLHIELYEQDYKGSGEWWKYPGQRPKMLLDPTPHLLEAWCRVTDRFHRDVSPVPDNHPDRQKLISWVMDHPLWNHKEEYPHSGEVTEDGGGFYDAVSFMFQYVDPTVQYIRGRMAQWEEDDRNWAMRIWIEAGGWNDLTKEDPENWPEPAEGWDWNNRWIGVHDYDLNCGGWTPEEALLNLAQRVKFFYNDDGSDREDRNERCELEGNDPYVSGCVRGPDGFCTKCGRIVPPYEKDDE